MTFPNRNDIQPILIQLPVGTQSYAERVIRRAHGKGWHSFYIHPVAVECGQIDPLDLCGINPLNGEHDFLVMTCMGDGGILEVPE
jgi:hypothetical protein